MSDYQKFYNELNAKQRLAVDTTDGPVLVLAGPGTGKTQLLSIRAGSILKKEKVGGENILILTYTNTAVREMRERLAKVIGVGGYDIEVATFHSFANSIIQESEEAANYVGSKIQMSDVERVRALEYALDHSKGVEEIRPFRAPYVYLREILAKIGELKRDGISPDGLDKYLAEKGKDLVSRMEERHLKRLRALAVVYRMYEDLKALKDENIFDERGRYDFDDMIIYAAHALAKERDLRERYKNTFRYIMVDEYQDTNGAQLELLFALLDRKRPNICCVGDDDQSIYRFQGASVGNFRLLKKRFPEIKVINLVDNYRSSKELIDVSTKVIGLIPKDERMMAKALKNVRDYRDKEIEFREFTTEEEELLFIIDKIKELKDKIALDKSLPYEMRLRPYNNIAILVRKRKSILRIIDALLLAGIPYATDGKEDISQERRVCQLLDILELAYLDPHDCVSKDLVLYKVLTSDYLEIPHNDVLKFINYVNAKKSAPSGMSLLTEFLAYFSSGDGTIVFEKKEKMRSAAKAIENLLKNAHSKPVHMILMDYVKEAGMFRYILREYTDKSILRIRELRALSSFITMVKNSDLANPGIRLEEFMREMRIRKSHDLAVEGNLVTMTQDGVRVYTAHGAKGHEFHSVFIPFCLQNKNWPARPVADRIPLPLDLFKTKERAKDRDSMRQLFLHDETRLFYVAMTRAKSNLIFTASPSENAVSSFYLTGLDIAREGTGDASEEELIIKSLNIADVSDPFIGTEAVLKDLVSNLSLNPTRLNNYITCPRKFLYNDVLRLPGPKKRSLVFGNCVHKALEETYLCFQDKKVFPDFGYFLKAFQRELKFQGVDDTIEIHCSSPEQMAKLEGWFLRASDNPIVPIGLERKLVITLPDGIIFTGKYDKTEWEDETKNLVRIVDYKTGKPDEHLKNIDSCKDLASDDCDSYLRQLVAYKLLFDKDKKESRGRTVRAGELVFIEPVYSDMRKLGYRKGDYVTKSVIISDTMVGELEEIIKDVWKRIKALQFDRLKARDNDKCGKCDFDAICWR